MNESATDRLERPLSLFLTRAALRYRDGACLLMEVLREEAAMLRRAGFFPTPISLTHEDGTILEPNLWSQDTPQRTGFLAAGFLPSDDEPAPLSWEGVSQSSESCPRDSSTPSGNAESTN